MKKLFALAAALLVVPMLAFALPVFAESDGQLATGPDLYLVKNVTKNTSYSTSTTATCDETVKFSVKLANSEFGLLKNVTVKASLANGVSTMVASATNAANQNTSVTANVTTALTKGTLVYVPGSTKNYDVNGTLIKSLPDGVTAGGVNKGNLNGSTREFVQWEAKVKCEEIPQTPTYSCDLLEVNASKDRKVTVSNFKTSAANGAVFKHAVLSWGDNSANVTTATPVGQSHTYNADGTYAIKATAVFTVNGQDVNATSANCAKQVTFKGEQPPKVTITVCDITTKKIVTINQEDFDSSKHTTDTSKCVETPTELVNTGAGSILGMFAAVTVAGALAHRFVLARRS